MDDKFLPTDLKSEDYKFYNILNIDFFRELVLAFFKIYILIIFYNTYGKIWDFPFFYKKFFKGDSINEFQN